LASRSRLLASLALAGLMAGGAGAQTLQDSLASAYRGNPQLEADRARQRAADDDVSRAWGGYRPQVVVSGQAGQGKDRVILPQAAYDQLTGEINRYTALQKDYRKPNEEAVQLKQEIWDGNRTFADVSHSKWAVANGRAILTSTEQAVLGGAVQAYYDLYRDQRIVDIQKEFVHSLEGEKKAAISRYAVKDVTQTDVAQAEARLARGVADLKQYEGNLEASRSAFTLAVGIEPGARLPDPPDLPHDIMPQSVDEALEQVEENPDLRAAIYAEKAAESDIDLAESGMMPDVSLQAVGSHSAHTDYTAAQLTTGQVLLTVTMPLYDGGVASARTRAAKHTFGQRRLTTDLQRIRTRDAIRRAWENLQATRARIRALEENERANLIALKGVQQELKVGSRTEIDALNAEQEVLDARIGLLRSQHDYAVSGYSLLLAVGRLTAASLKLPVEIYDPAEHYDSATWMPWGPWIDKDYADPTKVKDGEMPGGSPYPGLPDIDLPEIKLPFVDD
jgi:outer membrane protein